MNITPCRRLRSALILLVVLIAGLGLGRMARAQTLASLILPSNGAVNVSPLSDFFWISAPGAEMYYVYVGSAPGAQDVFNSGELNPEFTSIYVPNLKGNTTYYVQLWTRLNGVWADTTSSFSTGIGPSQLIYPANGQAPVDYLLPFTWIPVPQALSYRLTIGTTYGGSDVYDSGPIQGTSATVTGVQPMTPYYVRLYTNVPGASLFSDSTFTSGLEVAHLSQPADGASGVNPENQFIWTAIPGAAEYVLYIGTSVGASNVFQSVASPSTNLTVPNLSTGMLYYARLWTHVNNQWVSVDSTFTTWGAAALAYPANGATGVDPFQPFSWAAAAGATSYTLTVGSALGGADIFSSGPIGTTSVLVTGLQPSQTYYARLVTQTASGATYTDASFTTGSGNAHLINPANGAINVDPGTTFTWNSVPAALGYVLYVGTSVGALDVFQSVESTSTSTAVPGLLPGGLYYARLWTHASSWTYVDSIFYTGYGIAHLTSPLDGASNVDPNASFTWTAPPNATSYQLTVGTSAGASDVFSSGTLTTNTVQVTGLQPGVVYYARLTTVNPSGSSFADTSFSTGGAGLATLTSPVFGATGVDPFAPFTWNAAPGAQLYYLYVGTSAGATDILNSGELQPTVTSLIVPGLLGGTTYYVSLWTKLNGIWGSVSGTITTGTESAMDPVQQRNMVLATTAAVRGMTVGVSNTPQTGTPLAQVVADDGKTVAFCGEYAKTLAQQLTNQRITARIRNSTFDGTGLEVHTTVEYLDSALNAWVIADANFGFVFWNPSAAQGLSMEQLSALIASGSWSTIQAYLEWATPSQAPNPQIYGANNYIDPVLFYLNPYMAGSDTPPSPLPNNPAPFLTAHSGSELGTVGNWIFSVPSPSGPVTVIDPLKGTLTLTPFRSGFANAQFLNTGWSTPSPPTGLDSNTANRYLF